MKLTERQINTIINNDSIDGNRWEKNGKVRIYLDNQSLDDIVDNNPDCDCSYVCGSNGARHNTVVYFDMVSGDIVATYKGRQEEYVEQRVIDIIDWLTKEDEGDNIMDTTTTTTTTISENEISAKMEELNKKIMDAEPGSGEERRLYDIRRSVHIATEWANSQWSFLRRSVTDRVLDDMIDFINGDF